MNFTQHLHYRNIYKLSISFFLVALFALYKHFLYSLWAFAFPSDALLPTVLDILFWVAMPPLLILSWLAYIQLSRFNPRSLKGRSVPITLNLIATIVLVFSLEEQLIHLNQRVFSNNRNKVVKYIQSNAEAYRSNYSSSEIFSLKEFNYVSAGNVVKIFPKGSSSFVLYFPDYKTKFRYYAYVYVPDDVDCASLSSLKVHYYNQHWCYISSTVK